MAFSNLAVLLLVIVLAFAGILFAGGAFAALPMVIAEAWLVLHLVPVTYDATTLGMLPLLPALGVASLVAWRTRKSVQNRVGMKDLYTLLGLTAVIPLTLAGIAWFMLWDASKVFPVEPPAVWVTVLHPVAIHAIGMAIGMGPKLWLAIAKRSSVPEDLVAGATHALKLLGRLAVAAGIVYLILLATGYQRIDEVVSAYPSLTGFGIAGIILACLLYLPNAFIATLAVLLGGNFTIGDAQVSLFSIDLVPLPAFPLFAAIPGAASEWVLALMIVPLAGVIHFVVTRSWNATTVVATAVFVGLAVLIATYFSSGVLGVYRFSGPTPWLAGLLALAWVGLSSGIVWGAAVLRNRQARTVEPEQEPEEVLDDEVVDVEEVAAVEDDVDVDDVDVEVDESAGPADPDESVEDETGEDETMSSEGSDEVEHSSEEPESTDEK
ncbi:DUF6350 family protein [Corynebacterium breve]|uniref:DUF6350 family protein n=1 Tax=Corynebacterium breve TaxID=3049799 RepID=A0ABY8VH23_9CORY|nr:DUF6350 family protein [Corynebacterium breve]WIM68387.1 DUF6350 family protein [Corynebacterium breve]